MKELTQVLSTLSQSSSATFASLEYTSKGTGEVARHTINLNVDLERVYREDLEFLKEHKKTLSDPINIQACDELIASLENSLEKGIGNNVNYSQKDVEYIHFSDSNGNLIKGIKMHPDTQDIILSGYQIHKQVIKEGEEKKPKKSRPLTIAKNRIRSLLKNNKFRQYVISTNAENVKVHGQEIILN
jgi:hypothetical protein